MRHLWAVGLMLCIGAVCTLLAASILENYEVGHHPADPTVQQAQTSAGKPSVRPWMF